MSRRAARRFNVATAPRPWKLICFVWFRYQKVVLQCGHGRAAVESVCAKSTATYTEWLQCGHGRAAVESRLATSKSQISFRFNVATAARPWNPFRTEPSPNEFELHVATAARPWNPTKCRWDAWLQKLPCGHGRPAVESFPFWRINSPTSELQCGHGRGAVESVGNRQPRPAQGEASRGHGRAAVESGIRAAGRLRSRSFNVATAARPWNRRIDCARPYRTNWLHCGYGRAAVESSCLPFASPASLTLQCGHGRAAVESGWAIDDIARIDQLQCGHGRAAVESFPPRIFQFSGN